MINLFDTNIDIKIRLFRVLGATACFANTVGFIVNAVFYGFTWMTLFCGICAVIMYVATILGIKYKHIDGGSKTILAVINLMEFPILYYSYGPGRFPYMILGLVGIIIFLNGKRRIVMTVLTILIDAAVVIVSVLQSSMHWIEPREDMGATLMTYLISAISVSLLIALIIRQYQMQNEKMVCMTDELKSMACLDPLTKIFNRGYLAEYIDKKMKIEKQNFLVVLLDLDDFKSINDNFGHVYGDDVLKCFADSLKRHIKGNGIAARYGGEEFMLVSDIIDEKSMNTIIGRIQEDLKMFSKKTKDIVITFSGGVEIFYGGDDKITKLFNAVDEKLYEAKKSGKNTIVYNKNITKKLE